MRRKCTQQNGTCRQNNRNQHQCFYRYFRLTLKHLSPFENPQNYEFFEDTCQLKEAHFFWCAKGRA